MPQTKKAEYGAVNVELEIPINASRKQVWKTLIEEPGQWWPKDFYGCAETKSFVIEPKVGGRVYEDAGGGAGLLWYTVVTLVPESKLQLAGHMFPGCGGPSVSQLTLELEDVNKGTKLTLRDSTHGLLSPDAEKSLDSGWNYVFGALKALVEKKR